MEHVLDNPAWNALTSGNSNLANGTAGVKYFDQDVSPFIGLENNNKAGLQQLYQVLPHSGPVGFVSDREMPIPAQWRVLNQLMCYQMVYESDLLRPVETTLITPLSIAHVPQMLALTQLTVPGPFTQRTINFGHYAGIFHDEQLVAMAGQRMNPFNYAEISAVCTHPNYLGRGFAKQLLNHQINRIKAEGNIPFLHVRNDNDRAVKVYQSIGFAVRQPMYFYILQKQGPL